MPSPPRSSRCSCKASAAAARAPALLSRIDDTHANPQAEWLRLGSPEYPQSHQVDALEVASLVTPERIEIHADDGGASFTLPLPANAMALVRIEWEAT